MNKILIADDDPVMIKLLEHTLKRGNYEVIICREGNSVVKKALDDGPLLAIFDLVLPGKTGLELTKEFRANDTLKDLPIIIITQKGKESTKTELLDAGATAVLTKPYSPKALLGEINQLTQSV